MTKRRSPEILVDETYVYLGIVGNIFPYCQIF